MSYTKTMENGNNGSKRTPVTVTVSGAGHLTNWSVAMEIAALLEHTNADVTVSFNKNPRMPIDSEACIDNSTVTVKIVNEP